ncbi:MAG: CAP domain-containing protein [Actinomycetota bacterium]
MSAINPSAHLPQTVIDEQRIIQLVEQARSDHKLPPLEQSDVLTASGRREALTMAEHGEIFHQLPLHNYVAGSWRELGEDVGTATTADDVFTMFMQSPEHRSLILDPTFRFAGAGVSSSDNWIYVSLKFGTP